MSKERAIALAHLAARQMRRTMYIYQDTYGGWFIGTRLPDCAYTAVYVSGCQDTFAAKGQY